MDPCPVLVGRQPELSQLRDLLDARGGVAIVSGEAGIGKSRLVREFAAEAAERGRLVLWARPEEVAQPGPYALVVDLLQSISERGSDPIKREAFKLASDLTRSDADGQRPAPNPRAVAAEIRGLIAQLGRPPLIVLEDLHWADEVSHSVVLHLARAARDDEHVYIATLRPESVVSEASLGRLLETILRDRIATEIELGPLAADETARMLEYIWSRPPTPAELSDLSRLGEGVPFFIEELATAGGRIPRTIEQSVSARVRDLGDEAARVLTAASLMTGALDVAVLGLACDVPEERVADHLTAAARAGLLEDLEGRLVFRHSLARDAIATGLVSVEATQTHGRLAAAIEKVHSGELDLFSGQLARHYREAGETQAAVDYAVRAGHRALAFAATEEARAAFRLALDLSSAASTEALQGLAEVEFREGNESEAARLFRDSADTLKQHGDREGAALTLGRLAWTLQGGVESSEVLRVLDEGLELTVEEEVTLTRAKLMVQKGVMLTFALRTHGDSKPILTEALALAQRLGDAGLVAEALDGLAHVAEANGDWIESIDLGAKAIDMASRSGSSEVIGRAHNNHALALAHHGDPGRALVILSKGRTHLLHAHGRAAVGALDVTNAWIAMLMGRVNDVTALTARGHAAWRRWLGYRRLLETWAAIQSGESSLARSLVSAAWTDVGGHAIRRQWIEQPTAYDLDVSQVLRAEILCGLAGDQEDSLVEIAWALVSIDKFGSERIDLCLSMVLLVAAHAAASDLQGARSTLDELDSMLTTYQYPYLQALSLELHGRIASLDSQFAESFGFYSQAAERFREYSNALDRARCLRLAAELHLAFDVGKREDALEMLREARSLAVSSGAVLEGNRAESALRQLGIRPRAGRPKGARSSVSGELSARESEVVALVASGETNSEIGRKLFISERTVQDHISHALRKLRLPGRAALASWAVKQGML